MSVDPVAQSVEHNTFNVGVPGSSPGGITEEISDNQTIVGDFLFIYLPKSCFPMETLSHKNAQEQALNGMEHKRFVTTTGERFHFMWDNWNMLPV